MKSFPIVVGPMKQFNYRESNIIQINFLKGQKRKADLRRQNKDPKIEMPKHEKFLYFYIDKSVMKEGTVENTRIKEFIFGLAEYCLNIHG